MSASTSSSVENTRTELFAPISDQTEIFSVQPFPHDLMAEFNCRKKCCQDLVAFIRLIYSNSQTGSAHSKGDSSEPSPVVVTSPPNSTTLKNERAASEASQESTVIQNQDVLQSGSGDIAESEADHPTTMNINESDHSKPAQCPAVKPNSSHVQSHVLPQSPPTPSSSSATSTRTGETRGQRSLIAYGISEALSPIEEDACNENLNRVKACFKDVLGTSQKVGIVDVFRLGKDASGPRPRPLKVVLESVAQRDVLLANKARLRTNFPSVGFQRHFTPQERDAYKEALKELQRRAAQGEKDLIIRNGNVVQRKPTKNNRPVIILWGSHQDSNTSPATLA